MKITDFDSTRHVQEDLPCSSPLSRELTGAAARMIGSVQRILGDDRRKRGWRPWFTWANNPPDPMWGGRQVGSPLVQVRSWLAPGRADIHDNSDILIGKIYRTSRLRGKKKSARLSTMRDGANICDAQVEDKKGVGTYHRWPGSDVTWP